MLELFLVRHGETLGNRHGVFYGKNDYPLTKRGKEQAKKVAGALSAIRPCAIYSSPLKRAYETAKIIASHHPDIKVQFLEDLAEMDFGIWEGLTHKEISKIYPASWKAWCDNWWDTVIPDGESANHMHNRVTRCMDEILLEHTHGQIVIVTHHGCLRSMVSHILGLGKEGYWHFKVEPGGVVKLEVDKGFRVITFTNL